MLICLERGADAHATATPSSRASVKSRMVYFFYLKHHGKELKPLTFRLKPTHTHSFSDAGLPRLSWKLAVKRALLLL